MIRENQRLFNGLNILIDACILLAALPVAYWLRFYVLPDGASVIPLERYMILNVGLTVIQVALFALFGLYGSFRHVRLRQELPRLWQASLIGLALLFSWLFLDHGTHYSRLTWGICYLLAVTAWSLKRVLIRQVLRLARRRGYNQKWVLLIGSGEAAQRYCRELAVDSALGYQVRRPGDAERRSETAGDAGRSGGSFRDAQAGRGGLRPGDVRVRPDAPGHQRLR